MSNFIIKQLQNTCAANEEDEETATKLVKSLTSSPLGQIMSKIGLRIGVDTGSNLNKLIQKKPSKQEVDTIILHES